MARNYPMEDFKILKALIEANISEKVCKEYNSPLDDSSLTKLSSYLDRELRLEEDLIKIRLMALSLENGQTISVFECLKLAEFIKDIEENKKLKLFKEDQKNSLEPYTELVGKGCHSWEDKDSHVVEEFFKLNLVLNGKTLDSIRLGYSDFKLSLDIDQTDFKIKLLSKAEELVFSKEVRLEDLFDLDEGDTLGTIIEDFEIRSLGSSEDLSKEIDQDLLT